MKKIITLIFAVLYLESNLFAQNWGYRYFKEETDYYNVSMCFMGYTDGIPDNMDGYVAFFLRDYENDKGKAINTEFYYKTDILNEKAILYHKKTREVVFNVEIHNGKAFIYDANYEFIIRIPEVFP